MDLIKGKTGEWEVIIGLEVHAQVTSKSKLFSGASTEFGAEPNTQVSLVDCAMPGMLPVINEYCIEQAIKTGLGINAQINLTSIFDRKNYFYADLPQGYQISQFLDPIVGKGIINIELPDGRNRDIGVTRIHLEQDAGKSIHDQSPQYSFIDLNRSGIALMEIVSEPDIRSAIEAGEYMKKLRTILRYLGTCDGDMEKGSMRCDANVSVRKPGDALGTRCEIKNINSIKNIIAAIEYEARRQIEVIEEGGVIIQETRLFNDTTGTTHTMRTKEDAMDYRYFPDPDLLPLVLTEEYVESIKNLCRNYQMYGKRYMETMNLSPYDAGVIISEKEIAEYFEQVISHNIDSKIATNWITGELFAKLNKAGLDITSSPVTASQLAGLIKLITDNIISGKIAKGVFETMFETGKDALNIVEEEGLQQVTDTKAIEKVIEEILANNADKVAEYKSGKDRLFGFFVGQVMKLTEGKANPEIVNELLKNKLGTA